MFIDEKVTDQKDSGIVVLREKWGVCSKDCVFRKYKGHLGYSQGIHYFLFRYIAILI